MNRCFEALKKHQSIDVNYIDFLEVDKDVQVAGEQSIEEIVKEVMGKEEDEEVEPTEKDLNKTSITPAAAVDAFNTIKTLCYLKDISEEERHAWASQNMTLWDVMGHWAYELLVDRVNLEDFELWLLNCQRDWKKEERICQVDPAEAPLNRPQLSTSPLNPWVCLTHRDGLEVFALRSDQHHINLHHMGSYLLPLEDDPGLEHLLQLEQVLTFWDHNFHMTDYTTQVLAQLPLMAATGLTVPAELRRFCDRLYQNSRLSPTAHCWLPGGFILLCCSHSVVLKIKALTGEMVLLRNPRIQVATLDTASFLASPESDNFSALEDTALDLDEITCWHGTGCRHHGQPVEPPVDGSTKHKGFHTKSRAKFPGCGDPDGAGGCDLLPLQYDVTGATQGDLTLYRPNPDTPDLQPNAILNLELSEIVGLAFFQPQCKFLVFSSVTGRDVVSKCARDSGLLELFRASSYKKEHMLDLGERISALATSPTCHLVAASSAVGGVYFVCLRDNQLGIVAFHWILNSIPLPFIK
ncbi:hypothetical protein LAZ67_20001312 [Cordylochernes scorpioides]|uniref:Uncharacterized protein n=1 Tax=Cordylochernes scorpioides TaxID=51811 RepID=A0ABY6LJS7_9ARAC|nr:hypothetical protein LAZ67_20001312 [Cordylochernes scorpioides]